MRSGRKIKQHYGVPMDDTKTPQIGTEKQPDSNPPAQSEQENVGQGQRQVATTATKQRTYRKKERMLAALAKLKGANITQAAQLAGIDRATHYKWLHSDPKYKERAENAFQELIDSLESVAYTMAMEKNPQVLLATLKAKAKDRGWGENPQTAVQTNVQVNTGAITIEQFKAMARKAVGLDKEKQGDE